VQPERLDAAKNCLDVYFAEVEKILPMFDLYELAMRHARWRI